MNASNPAADSGGQPPASSPATSPDLAIDQWQTRSGSERSSRANLVLTGGGHRWRAHASGDGAIDALMRAVDVALTPVLGVGVELASYAVHATRTGHDASGEVTVGVRRRDEPEGPIYPGRAVHDNVLHASLAAYLDAINAILADAGVSLADAVPAPEEGPTGNPDAAQEARAHTASRIQDSFNG